MSYFVSRQSYWGVDPEDQNVVEIAHGGLDYANPDMLVSKYEGEGQEYEDPREALTAALAIAEAWKKDQPEIIINIAHGFTGGNTMPFEPDKVEDLKAWAEKAWQALPMCDQCGKVLGKERYHLVEDPDIGEYCSEYCCERAAEVLHDIEEEVA
jgi:hypothetical protein